MQAGMMDYPLIIPNDPAVSAPQTDQLSSLTSTIFGNQHEVQHAGILAPQLARVTSQGSSPHTSSSTVERKTNEMSKTKPRIHIQSIDRNGRRRRVYTKTQFTCSHCPRKFSITNLETYCRHVVENNIQREFKCPEPTCPWYIIGFQRKLEKDRHYTRKHGIPEYECRFWAGPGKELSDGAGVCTTRWHSDAGNRARHERTVHGYYIPTQRAQVSPLDDDYMVTTR
ncbi:hypothetical protein V1509DRAFT_220238 [Lipomyces kononenkoae]